MDERVLDAGRVLQKRHLWQFAHRTISHRLLHFKQKSRLQRSSSVSSFPVTFLNIFCKCYFFFNLLQLFKTFKKIELPLSFYVILILKIIHTMSTFVIWI